MINSKKALATVRVKNNSNKYMDKLGFTYDGVGIQLFNLKNLGIKEIKEIEIPTEYFRDRTIIRMYTEDGRIYSIKEDVSKNENITIEISINEIKEDGSLEFDIL
ncbi:hypothetical protein [Clostridium massiliamazoniense]|uniref:hypothetical protein n=1 Tax=Clostridium massiliamazoniense TaxID=1347366 RepID=UPI0006D8350B|nr:hypothetical protein [Clostridium massiliamazoniense]